MNFGKWLRATRMHFGYTMGDLARRLDIGVVCLSDLENGNTEPNKDLQDKIFSVLLKFHKGVNIWSGSKELNGLAAALTNPTSWSRKKGNIAQDYPILVSGISYIDVEEYYQKHKTEDQSENEVMMARIISLKFIQHPRLYKAVISRGGQEWLEKCSHLTGAKTARFQRWEGKGLDSRFITVLVAGFLIAKKKIGNE